MSDAVIDSTSAPGVNGGTMLLQKELVVTKSKGYYYWYAYQRVNHILYKVYVGSSPRTGGALEPSLIKKGRDRLREKISKAVPC